MHLSSTLLPPVCHGTKMCLPKLVDHITSLKSEPVKRHRASQAAAALAKIHQLKKNGIVPHSLALKQIIELERKDCNQKKSGLDHAQHGTEVTNGNRDNSEPRLNGELECEVYFFLFKHSINLICYHNISCITDAIYSRSGWNTVFIDSGLWSISTERSFDVELESTFKPLFGK